MPAVPVDQVSELPLDEARGSERVDVLPQQPIEREMAAETTSTSPRARGPKRRYSSRAATWAPSAFSPAASSHVIAWAWDEGNSLLASRASSSNQSRGSVQDLRHAQRRQRQRNRVPDLVSGRHRENEWLIGEHMTLSPPAIHRRPEHTRQRAVHVAEQDPAALRQGALPAGAGA